MYERAAVFIHIYENKIATGGERNEIAYFRTSGSNDLIHFNQWYKW